MSESVKYETISLRLTKEDADLIRSYAERERVSVSALIRSSMVRLINQGYDFSVSNESPSPSLDKLSFGVRKALLRFFDLSVLFQLKQGTAIADIEKMFLFSQSLALQDVPNNIEDFKLIFEQQRSVLLSFQNS